MIGSYQENEQVHRDTDWPATRAGGAVIAAACASCHNGSAHVLPRKPVRRTAGVLLATRVGRSATEVQPAHRLQPESTEIVAHAAGAAGEGGGGLRRLSPPGRAGRPGRAGGRLCKRPGPRLPALLAMCRAGQAHLDTAKRFDMPGFRPRPEYLREMQRYGVLPPAPLSEGPLDPYALDAAYWRSLWHQASRRPASTRRRKLADPSPNRFDLPA